MTKKYFYKVTIEDWDGAITTRVDEQLGNAIAEALLGQYQTDQMFYAAIVEAIVGFNIQRGYDDPELDGAMKALHKTASEFCLMLLDRHYWGDEPGEHGHTLIRANSIAKGYR